VGDTYERSVKLVTIITPERRHTLGNLLSSVDLCDLLVEQLITLLAHFYDLRASNAELGNGLKDLVGDGTCILVLGESIWVVQGVIYYKESVSKRIFDLMFYFADKCRGFDVVGSSGSSIAGSSQSFALEIWYSHRQ
jgi:hypothetical protein